MAVFEGADPEFGEAFRAYRNYFEDLARYIQDLHGYSDRGWPRSSLVDGVHDHVLAHPGVKSLNRRKLSGAEEAALEHHLRKSWSDLRRMARELDDPDHYDDEANAWLPAQAYYAIYNAVLAVMTAGGRPGAARPRRGAESHRKPCEHGAAAGAVACVLHGVPSDRIGTRVRDPGGAVHVLSLPDHEGSEARLAMLLRTTRERELERRFADLRRKNIKPGQTRSNLSKKQKEAAGSSMGPTTLFDVFWRIRRKANYDDADTFVLGAESEFNARGFGQSLILVTDATVASLEAVVAAYVGPGLVHRALGGRMKQWGDRGSGLAEHAESWAQRAA